MEINAIILIMVIYVWVYYFLARRVLVEIGRVDPAYLEYSGARSGVGMGNSLAVGRMIFDGGLPKSFYPGAIKVKLIVVRVMLAASPFVFIAMLLLS